MGSDASCVIHSPDDHLPDETPVISSPMMMRFSSERLLSRFPDAPDVSTLEELFQHTKQIAPDDDFYGTRDYVDGAWQPHWSFISRATFDARRRAVGSFLISLGVKHDAHIGILSYSRIEWVIVQYACYGFGFIPVPVYDTFGWENINYIIKHAGLNVCFVVSTKVNELIEKIDADTCLTDVIVIDTEEKPYDYENVPQTFLRLHKYSDAAVHPTQYPLRPPKPSTPAFIMYTSGTTSHPKGCLMTHANFISTAASIYSYAYPFSRDDSMLVYLPLAHVYESVQHAVAMKVIGRLGFYSGSIPRLVEELKLFRPSIICGVSRVFERVKDGIEAKVKEKSKLVQAIFYAAFHTKSFLNKKFRITRVPGLDRVFDSVTEALGGRVKLFVSGGSALPPDVQRFLRIACRASFVQGYGLTESCSSCCVQTSTDVLDGNCGALLPWAEAKFRSVDGYNAKDMCGELMVRGPSIFAGYYRDEEATKQVLDESGFYKTGDIFTLNATGQLQMIGRCKELIKLSQGEYVSLQKLQVIYGSADYVKQIYIHASLTSRFLVAVVVVDKENVRVSKATLLNALEQKAAEHNLNGYERIKDIVVTTEEFTPDNGMMTPSLKLCGHSISKRYQRELDALEK